MLLNSSSKTMVSLVSMTLVLMSGVTNSAFAAKSPSLVQKRDLRVLDVTQKKGPSEKDVYSSLIKAYRNDNLVKTKSLMNDMLSFYPKSIFADNALYLTGILQLKKGRLGPSIKTFDTIIKKYPRANKRSAALYAKGIAYKKLMLFKPARKHLLKVIKSYPGSLESQRAKVELRLIKKMKKPKTASI